MQGADSAKQKIFKLKGKIYPVNLFLLSIDFQPASIFTKNPLYPSYVKFPYLHATLLEDLPFLLS
jgi:hypothetical protein